MKKIILASLRQLVADRQLLVLVITMIFIAIIASVSIGVAIHPAEYKLTTRYSAFGISHLYLNQWFYYLVFVLFEWVTAMLHSAATVKILVNKGHPLAAMFAWAGIIVLLVGWVMALSVIGWNPAVNL